jgi:DNA-binding LytR/AlgR family response regulator
MENKLSQNTYNPDVLSCIANLSKIKKFNASFSGSLSVVFKNGYTDYVSRRSVKFIKERLGLKL